jgi:fumarylacetoacetase
MAAPSHQSWLSGANSPATDFPLTHLPYGAFERDGRQSLCVAIGDHLLDLNAIAGLLPHSLSHACQAPP